MATTMISANIFLSMFRKIPKKICISRFTTARKYSQSSLFTPDLSEFTEEPQYPAVKPRFPPGNWAGFPERDAWKIWETAENLKEKGILHEKLDTVREFDAEKPIWKIKPLDTVPRILSYQQHVTKTHLIEGLPSIYENIDIEKEFAQLKPHILDVLIQEHEQFKNHLKYGLQFREPTIRCTELFLSLVDKLIAGLGQHDHILRSQVDLNARLECFWKRGGYKNSSEVFRGKDKHGVIRLQLNETVPLMIRSEKPLPQFVSIDDPLCRDDDPSDYKFAPTVLGQFSESKDPSVIAGYHTNNQFWDGDPREFGHLAFYSSVKNSEAIERYGEAEGSKLVIGQGMVSSFGWSVAQAYNQGFTWMNDVTYPFTGQSIVSNGHKISFYSYQLNTLLLWKNNEANNIRNLCWYTPEEKLYETIENGKVVGFNDNAFKTILKFMLNKPVDRGVELRPYLTEQSPLAVNQYLNLKGEEKIERPHPPRLFRKSKKQKRITLLDETHKKVMDKYEEAAKRWDPANKTFKKVEDW